MAEGIQDFYSNQIDNMYNQNYWDQISPDDEPGKKQRRDQTLRKLRHNEPGKRDVEPPYGDEGQGGIATAMIISGWVEEFWVNPLGEKIDIGGEDHEDWATHHGLIFADMFKEGWIRISMVEGAFFIELEQISKMTEILTRNMLQARPDLEDVVIVIWESGAAVDQFDFNRREIMKLGLQGALDNYEKSFATAMIISKRKDNQLQININSEMVDRIAQQQDPNTRDNYHWDSEREFGNCPVSRTDPLYSNEFIGKDTSHGTSPGIKVEKKDKKRKFKKRMIQ